MGLYFSVVYPAMLVLSGALFVVGAASLAFIRLHPVLKGVVTVTWIAVALHFAAVVVVLVGGSTAGIVITVGYLLASIALLPILGIGRLGEPPAPGEKVDPDRPVLRADQIARVDAIAAMIVSIALAVVAWRIEVILVAGAPA